MAPSQELEGGPPIIIVLGPPGSGKGTQAQRLKDRCNMSHLSPGALLRELKKKDPKKLPPKTRRELKKMERGDMVGHWLVYDLMFPKIKKALKKGNGVIIDGAIRTVEQVEGYTEFFEKNDLMNRVIVVYVHVAKVEAVKRLKARRIKVNGKWTKRDDDVNKKAMEHRFAVQGNAAQRPVLAALKKHVLVEKVDGHGTINQIEKRIANQLVKKGALKKKSGKYICI